MIPAQIVKVLTQNKTIKNILKVIFDETKQGKPGVSISQLSEKTGVERHKLAGMLEVLVVLGILVVFQMGMVKIYAPTKILTELKNGAKLML